ncbi:hypothetical protein SP90_13630 [Halodesulfovibrio spirochaetisodalis]|uniref:HTH cro/C1-type domain-containing protein n=1 Tax=Halodesulfovibrio spirochaetisodalis TaxID=1560234 RepID=A0A1B7XA68_9BACT|nr:hypothetical protein SP90_13630 [Halodesulfovibrio spirochaetisodalis]
MPRVTVVGMKNKIEEYRHDHACTVADIARMCGLHHSAVLRHCNGQRKIGGEAALRYYAKLGIPIEELRPELFAQVRPIGVPDFSNVSQKG